MAGRASSRLLAAACLASAALSSAVSAAQPIENPSRTMPGTVPPGSGPIEKAQRRPYWSAGTPRPFVAAEFDVGLWYVKPEIALGYGKPHWRWFGAEGQVRVSQRGGTEYGGIRMSLPFIEVRSGARHVFPVSQTFLPVQDEYTIDDIDREWRQSRGNYLVGEAELVGTVPIGPVSIFAQASGHYIANVPEGLYVYEEGLRVVAAPPWVVRGRVGFITPLGPIEEVRLGVAGEVIGLVSREEIIVRAGPVLGVTLTHHLEAVATVLPVLYSPDNLGLSGAEFGQLGLRYRWATGDRFPEFP